jgi:hypothetical protein
MPCGCLVAAATADNSDVPQQRATTRAFAVDGSVAVTVCAALCILNWDTSNGNAYLSFAHRKRGTLALPVVRGSGLPKISAVLTADNQTRARSKETKEIPVQVESAVNPFVYAYTRQNVLHNLYRIQLP